MLRYADTKLANMSLTSFLAKRWSNRVDVVAVTPGMVNTGLYMFIC